MRPGAPPLALALLSPSIAKVDFVKTFWKIAPCILAISLGLSLAHAGDGGSSLSMRDLPAADPDEGPHDLPESTNHTLNGLIAADNFNVVDSKGTSAAMIGVGQAGSGLRLIEKRLLLDFSYLVSIQAGFVQEQGQPNLSWAAGAQAEGHVGLGKVAPSYGMCHRWAPMYANVIANGLGTIPPTGPGSNWKAGELEANLQIQPGIVCTKGKVTFMISFVGGAALAYFPQELDPHIFSQVGGKFQIYWDDKLAGVLEFAENRAMDDSREEFMETHALLRVRVYHGDPRSKSFFRGTDIYLESGVRAVDGNFLGADGVPHQAGLIFMPDNKLTIYRR